MELIEAFNKKAKDIGGELFYSSRDIMDIFGYTNWEKFEMDIKQVYKSLDKEIGEKNFKFEIIKDIGLRNKKEIYLTLIGCYIFLKSIGSEDVEIKKLLNGIEKMINKSYGKKINIFSIENIFMIVIFFIIIFGILYYFKVFNNINSNIPSFNISQFDFEKQKLKQDLEIEKMLNLSKVKSTEINDIENIEKTDKNNINNYIKSGEKELKEFDKNLNFRNDFTKTLTGEQLISSYFILGNNGFYRDSCSLLSKKDCLSNTKGNLTDFGKYWTKTSSGYEILDIYKSKKANDKNVYCVKFKHNLNNDFPDVFITETYNFSINKINGFEEISGRYCEKIEKNGKIKNCPFKLKNYYCN